MARALRIEYEGAYYHVTSRGVARHEIFFDEDGREAFLQRLLGAHERWGVVFHGYCLMTNHVHLEVATPHAGLSRAMQWIMHGHASYVNRRHRRVGHLFQGRFKSVLVEAETHLEELTRYIHLNPVRAGLVDHPGDYRWSSYRTYLGLEKRPPWLDVSRTLSRFGKTRRTQVRNYRAFVEADSPADPLRDVAYGAILGTGRFVAWVRERFLDRQGDREVSGLARARPGRSVAAIGAAVARAYGVDQSALCCRGRKLNIPRDVAIYLARQYAGVRLASIGEAWGGIGPAAVSLAHRRIAEQLTHDRPLRRAVRRLTDELLGRED